MTKGDKVDGLYFFQSSMVINSTILCSSDDLNLDNA
jgi:hypothetical protein